MTPSAGPPVTAADVFNALGDPIRWSIVQQMAAVEELPCATLEGTLPVTKPTISYHTKILVQAGLVSVRKQGRSLFYTLRRDVLRSLGDDIWTLAPDSADDVAGHDREPAGRRAADARRRRTPDRQALLLTW
jgi:DNA-binding transcriptional ArsR family regulator